MNRILYDLARQLIGAMMNDAEIYKRLTARQLLRESHFKSQALEKTFAAIGECIADGEAVNAITVMRRSSLDKDYLVDLVLAAANPSDVESIAHILIAVERIPDPFPDRLMDLFHPPH